jgi:hypothetical protein
MVLAKIKQSEAAKLQELSSQRKTAEYKMAVALILKNHKCSPKTHLITVDGKIIRKPEWLRKGLPKPEAA